MPTNPFAALAAQAARGRTAQAAKPADDVPAQEAAGAPAGDGEASSAAPPAPAATKADAAAPAAASASRSLQVLTSTGNRQFDAILAGCVGTLDEAGCFKLDDDYARLSYLFTLAGSSSLPAVRPGAEQEVTEDGEIVARRGERTLEITMPADAAHALKINLVATGARGWDAMYEHVSGGVAAGAMGANMLQAERRMVAQAVTRYLDDSRLQLWNVPIIYQAAVLEENPAARDGTEDGLMAQAAAPSSITPDVTREPQLAGPAAGNAEATEPTAIPADWASHSGPLVLTIEGDLPVRAASAQEAATVTTALVMVASEIPQLWQQLRPSGRAIQAAQLIAPADDEDEDDSNGHRAPGMGG